MMNLPSNFGTPMMRDPRRPPRSHSRSHSESQLQMGKVDAATTSSTATTVCSTGNSSLGSAAMMHLQATLKEQSLMEAGLHLATGTGQGKGVLATAAKGPEADNQHKHPAYKPHSLPSSVTPLRTSASSGTGTGTAKMTDLNGQGGGNNGIHPISGPQAHHGHPSQAGPQDAYDPQAAQRTMHQAASQMQAQDQAVAPTLRCQPSRLDCPPQASVYPVQPHAHPKTAVPPGGAKPPLFQVLKTQTTDLSSHSSSLPATPPPSLPSGHAPDDDAADATTTTTTPTSSSVEKIRFSLLGITGEAILSASKRNLASELHQQPEDTTTQESTALDFRDELDVMEASSSRQLDLSDELKRRERANLYLHGAAIGGLVLIVLIILGLLFGT